MIQHQRAERAAVARPTRAAAHVSGSERGARRQLRRAAGALACPGARTCTLYVVPGHSCLTGAPFELTVNLVVL